MIMANPKEYYFIYPENKNGKRTGHTICVLNGQDPLTKEPRSFYGIALCSEEDHFEYAEGRKLSLDRAKEIRDSFYERRSKKDQ